MEAAVVTPEAVEAPRERRPLRELLPTGAERNLVVAGGVAGVAASFAAFGWSGRSFVGAILCPAFVLLAAIDLRHRLLPNTIIFPSTLAIVLIIAATDVHSLPAHLEAGLALFGFLFLFAALAPSGLGMGDAKAGLLLGVALGSRTLAAMFAAFFVLFVAAVWILVRNGLAGRKQSLPFGPFLALGAILAFFFA